jgi:hypothetical protein
LTPAVPDDNTRDLMSFPNLQRILFILASAAISAACAAAPAEEEPVDRSEQDLLGGVPARSVKYDAVGVLYGVRPTGAAPICSGTLIGPHTVLTAGHCVRPTGAPFNIIDRFPVFFAIGFDSAAPKRRVRAVWGGVTTAEGSDVGLYQLAEDVTEVTPFAVATAPIESSAIGSKYSLIGFGLQNATQTFSNFLTRRVGAISLTTFDAQPAHELFPVYEDFKKYMESYSGHSFTDAQAHSVYDHNIVRPGDAYFGSQHEASGAYLDSGAPYIAKVGSALTVFAVHSRSYRADPTVAATGTTADILPIGAASPMVGVAETKDLISTSLADPCRNLTSAGACSGTTAIRCATEISPPVIAIINCDEVGAVCKVDTAGNAGCDDP